MCCVLVRFGSHGLSPVGVPCGYAGSLVVSCLQRVVVVAPVKQCVRSIIPYPPQADTAGQLGRLLCDFEATLLRLNERSMSSPSYRDDMAHKEVLS